MLWSSKQMKMEQYVYSIIKTMNFFRKFIQVKNASLLAAKLFNFQVHIFFSFQVKVHIFADRWKRTMSDNMFQ